MDQAKEFIERYNDIIVDECTMNMLLYGKVNVREVFMKYYDDFKTNDEIIHRLDLVR